MSTALGHGLVDPKRRGKPVSFANKGGRVSGLMGALGFFSFFLLTGEGTLLRSLLPVEGERGGCSILSEGWRVLGHTPSAVSKGNPAKIPKPLLFLFLGQSLCFIGAGVKLSSCWAGG